MKRLLLLLVLSASGWMLQAQDPKKALTHEDILHWNRITGRSLSNDGTIVAYQLEPWKGDPVIKISTTSGDELASVTGGSGAVITHDSKYVVYTIHPLRDTVRTLKLKKTKKEKMPVNRLAIFSVATKTAETIPRLKSFKVPEKWNGWVAYQTVPREKTVITGDKENGKNEGTGTEKKKKEKQESTKNGYTLQLRNLDSGKTITFPFVTRYDLAGESPVMVFVTTGDDHEMKPGVYRYDLTGKKLTPLLTGKGTYTRVTMNKPASRIAFLAAHSSESKTRKSYGLYLWTGSGTAEQVLTNDDTAIPQNWEISANGRVFFSPSGNRLFFGTAPIRPEPDTTRLKEEWPVLDVWHWNEPMLHTQQLKILSRSLKKSYLAVFLTDEHRMVQLEDKKLTGISLIKKGDADLAAGWSNLPYAVQSMWEGSPVHNDFYLIDIRDGSRVLIRKNCRATPRVSPDGKYLYWYQAADSSWYTYNLAHKKTARVTHPGRVQCANELNDIPNLPGSYGTAGWLKDDRALLVYDRYDLWNIDPEGKRNAVSLTVNGRLNHINYRLIRWVQEPEAIDPAETAWFTGHNEITRGDGYYRGSLRKPKIPKTVMAGEYKLGRPVKAKEAEVVLYTRETFQVFPDLLVSNLKFKSSVRISHANPQQKEFRWGTAELFRWTSLDGRALEGTLHKPENFNPHNKYPLIVNFYEKSSQGLFNHRIPEEHRSTIDYHYYTSNGYVVFNPDIYYKEGYPGEDAFNCVMPGITALVDAGFIEKEHIGAQGHSWGGYQVAYLATRTHLFAAIESGAPVVNMFSSYGGIRWGSGLNRSFQYEHTQSRIGKSIWEAPLRYLENSPLFTVDKITTPMLIMHNDHDGAVPWYQGIEFFIALRRMGKTAWLLNYNEADHWPLKVRDKHDFQIRLSQFFDHYLKDQPMPKWMKEGIPATEKETELGYELVK